MEGEVEEETNPANDDTNNITRKTPNQNPLRSSFTSS